MKPRVIASVTGTSRSACEATLPPRRPWTRLAAPPPHPGIQIRDLLTGASGANVLKSGRR
jgi:hypothetical protein